jgi:hypothetical protein
MFLVGKVPKINQMCFMIVKKNFMFGKLSFSLLLQVFKFYTNFNCQSNSWISQQNSLTPTLTYKIRVWCIGTHILQGILFGERGSMSMNEWTWPNFFWNIVLTSKEYWKNIPWHMPYNISRCRGIFCHVYMDER